MNERFFAIQISVFDTDELSNVLLDTVSKISRGNKNVFRGLGYQKSPERYRIIKSPSIFTQRKASFMRRRFERCLI